ncbi:MAG: hypothetical protein IPM89_05050 [Candidatus Competibacteraceae bacterium]|nr:MAG: hypothetical protein IPM89_05050 [Candidatus Competibacteraceae bacterium]
MKHWKMLLLVATGVAMSGFFLAIMRPPGNPSAAPGRDLPWQVEIGQNGASSTVFGLTLGKSTLRDAVHKLGRRYEMGIFQERDRGLSLEAYFRDAVVGGLNARLVLSAQWPEERLDAFRAHAGAGQPTAGGDRRYSLSEADHDSALDAVVVAITYLPVIKFDADLVRKRFGEPAERLPVQDGMHWLYPPLGLDLLLGDNGGALLQYVPPAKFEQRLRTPLYNRESEERP